MEVILCMNTDLTPDEATLLYIGLTTDTGCFQYSNTSAASFRAAAELLLRGAVYAGVYGLAACVSGTAELCVPESLRPARRAEKARALR